MFPLGNQVLKKAIYALVLLKRQLLKIKIEIKMKKYVYHQNIKKREWLLFKSENKF